MERNTAILFLSNLVSISKKKKYNGPHLNEKLLDGKKLLNQMESE